MQTTTTNIVDPETGERVVTVKIDNYPGIPMLDQLKMRAGLALKITKAVKLFEGSLGKEGTNKDQNYRFVTAETIFEVARNCWADAGVCLTIEPVDEGTQVIEITSRSNAKGRHLIQRYAFHLIDTETGYSIDIPWVGEVIEYQDKAFSKALTSAMKYFNRAMLMLPTNDDDPDHENPTGTQAKPQATRKEPPTQNPEQVREKILTACQDDKRMEEFRTLIAESKLDLVKVVDGYLKSGHKMIEFTALLKAKIEEVKAAVKPADPKATGSPAEPTTSKAEESAPPCATAPTEQPVQEVSSPKEEPSQSTSEATSATTAPGPVASAIPTSNTPPTRVLLYHPESESYDEISYADWMSYDSGGYEVEEVTDIPDHETRAAAYFKAKERDQSTQEEKATTPAEVGAAASSHILTVNKVCAALGMPKVGASKWETHKALMAKIVGHEFTQFGLLSLDERKQIADAYLAYYTAFKTSETPLPEEFEKARKAS